MSSKPLLRNYRSCRMPIICKEQYCMAMESLSGFTPQGARRDLRKLVSACDILHIHGLWEPVCKAAADVAREAGVPYVIAPHGMLDPWSLSQRRLKKQIALALGYRRMLNGAAFLHVLNADEARLVGPLKLRCPFEVIPNGVFVEEIDPLPDQGTFRKAHPELASGPYILFLSRLHYKKGLDYLIEAFAIVAAKLPDVRLIIAGPDDGEKANCMRDAKERGLLDRVFMPVLCMARKRSLLWSMRPCFAFPAVRKVSAWPSRKRLARGVRSSSAKIVISLKSRRLRQATSFHCKPRPLRNRCCGC